MSTKSQPNTSTKLNRLQLLGYQSTTSSTSLSSKAILNRGTDCHWDFVLKEAIWLATDFQNERMRLRKKAKDVSKAAESYYKNRDVRKSKKEKEDITAVRRVSSKISADVRKFWLKINKLITFKQKGEYDEVRQKAMDKHLVYLVKQTERYTNLLAENMKSGGEIGGQYISDDGSTTFSRKTTTMKLIKLGTDADSSIQSIDNNSMTSSNYSSMNRDRRIQSSRDENSVSQVDEDDLTLDDNDDDDEFEADDEEPDDETTLIEAEAMGDGLTREEEISLLQSESEIPIEKLRSMYENAQDYDSDDGNEEIQEESAIGDKIYDKNDDDDDEFIADDEPDDETTMIEEEALGEAMSRDEEISMLQSESEIPIEQLRAMYANVKYSDDEESEDDDEYDEEDNDNDNDEFNKDNTDLNTTNNSSLNNAPGNESMLRNDRIEKKHSIGTVSFSEEVQMKIITNEKVDSFSIMEESNNAADDDDDEFIADDEPDDETTMIEEEALGEAMSRDEEISMLQSESEIPIEQLRAMYANVKYSDDEESEDDDEYDEEDNNNDNTDLAYDQNNVDFDGETEANVSAHMDDDDEFIADDEPDDETTMIEEEALGEAMSRDEEISTLQSESEIPIEQLRAMYANVKYSDDEESEDDDEYDDEDNDNGMDEDSQLEGRTTSENLSVTSDNVNDALKRLEAADLAARSVHVELPFLLSKKLFLREYQHVGLNWLVSLHERRLNGILADEMGLGKTIQTIAVLAYLAAYRGLWGPHLIVVPTSCIVNWETEFKRWCPNFKVITYYGSTKARKLLRTGWSKLNAFHVCITSYQLVVQDAKVFRRKRWYYMILDEAHNIKNFKSQRWQTLLNFNTQRRLLLTGTPLQNNLMELWSLMHFLMPHIFRSRKEFSYWFNNPLSSMVEGNRNVNNDLITRLHSIMRPFLLRRLKKDVAKQLPAKYEHTVMCKLSKRQQYLYEEFMSRSSTRSLMTGGSYMGMMNILMQLRKCCNHPDLFEVRSIVSPFVLPGIFYNPGSLVTQAMEKNPLDTIDTFWLNCLSINEDDLVFSEVSRLQANKKSFMTNMTELNVDTPHTIKASQFKRYNDELKSFLRNQRIDRHLFNYRISSQRCNKSVIPMNWRTFKAFTLEPLPVSLESLQNTRKSKWIPLCLTGLIKSIKDRANDMQDINERFIFVLPKAITNKIEIITSNPNKSELLIRERTNLFIKGPFEAALAPFYQAAIRQRIFFPDRKMVQFDSGKLQALSILLQKRKKGGHKCLIFTQMSKMLDILEVFLNLNAHTYVRLDGSTGIEKRQKLMDRFNSDPKLFCFILSTRSGGLGINLTGADTVIFYDSDWNPAMDAQAQDRAHRIGQTREVHIYRLVCSSTVEENILVKARQKKHLDFLVMTEGNFSETSIFSSHGLKDLLGAQMPPTEDVITDLSGIDQSMSKTDVEAAMAAAEDEEDVKAMRGANLEVAQEAAEFDENAPIPQEDPEDGEIAEMSSQALTVPVNNEPSANEEIDMEMEFASWQAKLGPDFKSLENALKPVERYAIRVRTDIDPFYSIYIITDQLRLEALQAEASGEVWNVEEIEREKEEEEYRALAEGELLAANVTRREISRLKDWYLDQRSKRNQERRRRMLTGEGWNLKVDSVTNAPFWYNEDTGEACYKKPKIIEERESMKLALEKRFKAMPINILINIFQFLFASPERVNASRVCVRWSVAAKDKSFCKRVLPVESGARDTSKAPLSRGTYASIEDALKECSSGDTIILGTGHHWETSLVILKPLRIVAETDDPSRCVVELAGKITVSKAASGTIFSGMTIRRPRKVVESIPIILAAGSALSIFACICNNDGSESSTILGIEGCKLRIYGSTITGGSVAGITLKSSDLIASTSVIKNNGSGVIALCSSVNLEDTYINKNRDYAFTLFGKCILSLSHCEVKENTEGALKCLPNGSRQSIIKTSKTICDIPNAFIQTKKKSNDEKGEKGQSNLSPREFRDAMNG